MIDVETKSARPFYNEFAWAYDLLQTEPIDDRVEFIEGILSRNGIASGSKILDAGCGTGRYAVEFAKRGFIVCAADRSPELIAVARTRDVAGAAVSEFVIGDLLGASFEQPFDAVLCRGVLNDFVADSDRAFIFRQFARWLRTGGILLFDVREWTRTAARYTENSLHRRSVELPNGVLQFQRVKPYWTIARGDYLSASGLRWTGKACGHPPRTTSSCELGRWRRLQLVCRAQVCMRLPRTQPMARLVRRGLTESLSWPADNKDTCSTNRNDIR